MAGEREVSVAERLASELEQGAELVDVGGFDIDAGQALTKLAQFQLADARTYVLRLAEAGLLVGATQLRFDVDGSSLTVAFDRSPEPVVMSSTALERLTSVLVSRGPIDADAPPRAVLVQLAVAALAISRLEPRYFAIESVGADRRGHRRVYAPEPKTELLADAEPGTRIYVVEGRELGRLINGLAGERSEQKLLAEHCQFARTPIFLNGRRISGKPLLIRPMVAEPVVDGEGRVIGEAGLLAADQRSARVHLLSQGLLIESRVLDGARPGFVAALHLPLARDLSQTAVARSPELDAGLEAVRAVHARLVSRLEHALARRSEQAVSRSTTRQSNPLVDGLLTAGCSMYLLGLLFVAKGWPFVVVPVVSLHLGMLVFLLSRARVRAR